MGTRPLAMEAEIKTVKRIGNAVELQTVNRSKLALSTGVLPLTGNILPDGQYYTSVSIGNPPRPYYLDVDTGSDLTWIQCDAPCTSCAKGPHPLYKPSKGNIVRPKDSLCLEVQSSQNNEHCGSCQQCDYEVEYADGSSSMGVLARDDVKLVANDNMMESKFVFGCAYDQQGHLLTAKTDGILGLSSARASLPSQLSSQGVINNVVGHCINREEDVDGYMFLGDDFVPRWGMAWVPTIGGFTNYYNSEVFRVSYGNKQLSMRGQRRNVGQVIFDTGSTYTYLTNEAYTNLISSLKSVPDVLVRDDSDPILPVCWRADFPVRSVQDVDHLFEPLTLQFGKRWLVMSTEFIIPPEGYLIVNKKGNICLGVLNGSEVLDGSMIILGDISLRGKLVVYDNVQQRIGWAESECDKPRKPNGFPFLF